MHHLFLVQGSGNTDYVGGKKGYRMNQTVPSMLSNTLSEVETAANKDQKITRTLITVVLA